MHGLGTVKTMMNSSASKGGNLSRDEERELAQKIRTSLIELWDSMISYPVLLKSILNQFSEMALEIEKRSKDESPIFDNSSFGPLLKASTIYSKQRTRATRLIMKQRRLETARALAVADGGADIARSIHANVRNGKIRARGQYGGRVFEQYIIRTDFRLNRYFRFRNIFIEKNVGLVMVIARARQFTQYGVPIEDLIQEGTFGLAKAIARFDPERGYKFSTYASWWIRAIINRYCQDRSSTIRLPANLRAVQPRFKRVLEKFRCDNIEPNDEELALACGITIETVKKLRGNLPYCTSTETEISGGMQIGDTIKDDRESFYGVELSCSLELARELISALPEREQYVICNRFAVDSGNGEEMTLQEIADEFKLSRERIRQIEEKALKSLKGMARRHADKMALKAYEDM